jgi:hypothetical protein
MQPQLPQQPQVAADPGDQLGLRVFSATMARERDALGDVITTWIRAHPHYRLIDRVVVQSSDAAFHCVTIVLFFHYRVSS